MMAKMITNNQHSTGSRRSPDLHESRHPASSQTHLIWLGLLLAAMIAALFVGWIGFMASDDSLYHAGAMRWLTDPPFPGSDHWSTRFPLTLSFAAVIALLGNDFTAFAVTAVIFYVILVAAVGVFAAKAFTPGTGWIAALLAATLPVVVVHASTVSVDLLEAAALLTGGWLVGSAAEDRAGLMRAAVGGAMFGVAVLCRETSVLALAVLGPLLLIGRPFSRRVLIACALGAALVLVGEALFQYAMTGDPLRRYVIAFNHDEHIDRAANHEGNFLLWAPLDPLLVLLINDDFGLLFWLAGVALMAGAWGVTSSHRRAPFLLLVLIAASSFLLVSVLYTKLVLNPRYFMLAALAAIILVAAWLDRVTPLVRTFVLALLVSTNLLLMGVGNAHPRWGMEALVLAAEAHPRATIAGNQNDVARADIAMSFLGQSNIRPLPAHGGDLVIAPADVAPAGDVVARYPSPPTRLGAALRWLGLEPLVPASIARRMFTPSPDMVLVRPQGG